MIHLNIHGPKTAASPATRASFSSYLKLGSLMQLANERAVGKAWSCWVVQFLPNSNRNVHSSHICAFVSGNLIPPRLFMYTLNFPSSIAYEKLETSQPLILSKKSTPMLHIAPKSLRKQLLESLDQQCLYCSPTVKSFQWTWSHHALEWFLTSCAWWAEYNLWSFPKAVPQGAQRHLVRLISRPMRKLSIYIHKYKL